MFIFVLKCGPFLTDLWSGNKTFALMQPYKEMGCGLCFDGHHSAVEALSDLKGECWWF